MKLLACKIILVTGIIFTIPVTFFAQNWTRVGSASSAWGGGLNNSIESLYSDTINNRLYVSGFFNGDTSCHSSSYNNCKNLAYWDNISWHYIGDSIGFPSGGRMPLVYYQGKLLTANFRLHSYGTPSRLYFAYHNGNYWTRTDSVYGQIARLKLFNSKLYAVGLFDTINGVTANDIAYKDSAGWHALDTTTWGVGLNNGGFNDVSVYNGDVYIAGNVASYDGTIRKLGKWNGIKWSNVGGTMFGSSGFDGVSRLCVYKGELYAGGYFNPNNGDPGWSIAKWNGNTWSQLGSGLRDSFADPGIVDEMMVINNKLVISGSFSFAGGVPANNIVEWDGTKFCAFGGTFDNEINAFSNYNNQIYIAGPRYADTVFIANIGRWVGGNYRDSCANDGLTGIRQIASNNQRLTIYPNPTSKTISLNIEGINNCQNSVIAIQNMLGQTISKLSFANNVDVSDLQPGCYFIQVTLSTGEIYKAKFIKQ